MKASKIREARIRALVVKVKSGMRIDEVDEEYRSEVEKKIKESEG